MSIPQIEFASLGRSIPQIGFGCARLFEGLSLRQPAKMLETALVPVIRYFDVALSYGLGTIEGVPGAAR